MRDGVLVNQLTPNLGLEWTLRVPLFEGGRAKSSLLTSSSRSRLGNQALRAAPTQPMDRGVVAFVLLVRQHSINLEPPFRKRTR